MSHRNISKKNKQKLIVLGGILLLIIIGITTRQIIEANKFENRFDFDLISPDIVVDSVEAVDPRKSRSSVTTDECRKEGEIANTGEFSFGECCEGLEPKQHESSDNTKDVGLYCEKP